MTPGDELSRKDIEAAIEILEKHNKPLWRCTHCGNRYYTADYISPATGQPVPCECGSSLPLEQEKS